MTVTVRVPHGMAWCADGQATVHASGSTIREVWANLHAAYPELMWRLSLEQGPPSFWVRIFVDGIAIDPSDGFLDTAVHDGAEMALHVLAGSGPGSGAGI